MFFDRSKTPKRSGRYLFDCEALIIAGEGAEFRPKRFKGKFDLHQRAYAIHGFGERLVGNYLFYYLEHVHEYFQRVAVGATVKSLRQRHFDELPILLPPLEEQRRIVAVLDEAFAAIATATANAQKNLANARELLGSTITELFDTVRGQDRACELNEFCARGRIITYGVIKLGDHQANGIPCLRTSNVRWLRFDLDGMKLIHPDLSSEYRRTILQGGEVLVNVRGTLGGVAVASPKMAGWNVSREVAVVPCDQTRINSAFLAYWIGTAESQKWLTGVLKGAAYTGINISDLRTLPIPVLSLEMQQAIVKRLDESFEQGRLLVGKYEMKLSILAALKQSLLHRAFTGELTAGQRTPAAIQTPTANDNHFATPAFTANVIALAQRRHEQRQRDKTFGHVKAQKALHLVESIGGIDLGRQPIRDAAGPNDFQHMLRATDWAVQRGFFEFVPRANGKGYDFKKLANYDALMAQAEAATQPVAAALEKAIDLIVDTDSDFAELIATTHAAWNNLIIDNAQITDDAIVLAARDNWHESKLRHDPARFHDAIRFIRTNSIIPDGTAKYVGRQEQLF